MQHMQRFFLQKNSSPFSQRHHQVSAFYSYKGFLLKISLNEHRFKGVQKYLSRNMLTTKKHTVNFAFSTSKHDGFMCQVLYGTSFEGVDCLQVQIAKAKRSKYKEHLSLEKIDHGATFLGKRDEGNV